MFLACHEAKNEDNRSNGATSGRTPRIMGMTPDRQRIKQTKPFMMEHPVSAQK
jgi:hypothetical protein